MSTTAAARGKGYAGRGRRQHEDQCKANEGDRMRADKGKRAMARVD